MWHFRQREHTTAFFRAFERSMSPDDISRTFHQVSRLSLSRFFSLSLLLSLSHFESIRNSVGSASAVFLPPPKNCVIEAKWVGKSFRLVSRDFAKKKCKKLQKNCHVKITYQMSILKDGKRLESLKRKVFKCTFHFSNLFLELVFTYISK